jgi:hypothetical protein
MHGNADPCRSGYGSETMVQIQWYILTIFLCSVSAKLFREPVSKSNRPIVMNAVEYVVFPGAVNRETRQVRITTYPQSIE